MADQQQSAAKGSKEARPCVLGRQHSLKMRLKPEKTGQLNPEWLEWLMGWPMGWTGLEPLEMDKFQEWLRQHG